MDSMLFPEINDVVFEQIAMYLYTQFQWCRSRFLFPIAVYYRGPVYILIRF